MKALVFTRAAFALARQQPAAWWASVTNPSGQQNAPGLFVEVRNDIGCYWTARCSPLDPLLVIGTPEVFSTVSGRESVTAAGRIAKLMHVGLYGGRIPAEYGPFRHGNKSSAFAYSYSTGRQRMVAEARPLGTEDFFVCGFGGGVAHDLVSYQPDYGLFSQARNIAVEVIPRPQVLPSVGDITLDTAYDNVGTGIGGKMSWDVWYPHHVNIDQRRFIDMPFDRPIRLRGSAGTGKTLTLAIKAMKLLEEALQEGRPCRILFITHSWALADAVEELMDELDPGRSLRQGDRSLTVYPLLPLADDAVKLGAKSRRLLGSDSRAGKIEMVSRLTQHIDEYLKGDWIARHSGCSPEFVARIEAPADSVERRLFVWDVANEISTVFAAAGIHPRRRQEYIRLARRSWMWNLRTNLERETVADLYQLYTDGLIKDGLTGPEQLVSDYLKALSTFEWERLRKTEGYDFVFVDEMHLFDEQERFVLHQLVSDVNIRPRVAMAIDLKQSPLAIYGEIDIGQDSRDSADVYKRANLPDTGKFDLTIVFRSTPEISRFVQSIADQLMHVAPLVADEQEWTSSRIGLPQDAKSGSVPVYCEHADSTTEFKVCFETAKRLAKEGASKRVAIICMDGERFDTYLSAASGSYKSDHVAVASQEDVVDALKYNSRRFVVSMPEYVGGLQFDQVLVLDVNDVATTEDVSSYHRKQFLTDLYIACSRAQTYLALHASKKDGGISGLLRPAIIQRLIVEGLK
jgi:hypothetical protein